MRRLVSRLFYFLGFLSLMVEYTPVNAQEFNPRELLRLSDSLSVSYRLKSKNTKYLPVFYQQANLDGATTVGNTQVWDGGIAGLSLSGNGLTIGYWDQNQPRLTHQEYSGRVTFEDSEVGSNDAHATQMVGTMIATGIQNTARGMANQSEVEAWNWNNDLSEMATAAASGLLLSEHPYTNTAGWRSSSSCGTGWTWYTLPSVDSTKAYQFGYYDNQAELWDSVAYLAPNYLIVKAAGNQRGVGPDSQPITHWTYNDSYNCVQSTTSREINGGESGYETLSSASLSKNVLVVGAVESSSDDFRDLSTVTPYSSSGFGPTDDGRIKPDIVAPTELYTSNSSSDISYATAGGTSAASALVTGSIALIREHYQNLFSDTLTSASIRGLLAHTADDIGEIGPDYKTGWGLLNTERAIRFLSSYNNDSSESLLKDTLLTDGGSITIDYTHSSSKPLIVTIAWTDPPGTQPTNGDDPTDKILVNDLNLQLTDPDSDIHYPWVLDPASPSSAATFGTNSIDNIEQVFIANPEPGTYQLSITHTGSLSGGSQKVSILISPDEPTIPVESIADGNWTSSSSWQNGLIPTSSLHKAVLKHSITLNADQTIYGISLDGSSSSLTLNNHNLTLRHDFNTSGSHGLIGDSLASLTIEGWNASSDSLLFAENNRSLGSLIIDASKDSVVLSRSLSVYDSLFLKNGTLDVSDGDLLLKSDSSKSAVLIKESGSLVGNFSYSRRFTTENAGWRMISSPFEASTFSDLNANFFTQGGDWAENVASAPNSSLWFYNQSSQAFEGYYGPDSSFSPGSGYLFYMFDEDLSGNPILPASMQFSGNEQDSVILNLHRGADDSLSYALVGNPFAGAIDWDLVVQNSDSISSSYAVWNPSSGSSGYVYYNAADQVGDAGRYIAPLQGFFVYATGSSSELRFRQSQKTGGIPKLYGKQTNSEKSSVISLTLQNADGEILDNQARLIFSDHGSKQQDPSDVYRLPSLTGIENSISFTGFDHRPLVFEGRSNSIPSDTVDLHLDLASNENYIIKWEISPHILEEWSLKLLDRLNNQLFSMTDSEQTNFFNDISSSQNKHRFSIIISRNTHTNSEDSEHPILFALNQNYPNPFNPNTIISYQLPTDSRVTLKVYDLLGRQVSVLVDEFKNAGNHTINFNAQHLSSGVYIYRLEAGEGRFIQTRKMILVK